MDYSSMVRDVFENGEIRESRLGKTSEVIGFQVEFQSGLVFARPKMQRKLGWVEGLQVIGGVFYPSDFRLAAPKLQWEYTIDAGYGTKISDQMPFVIDQLKSNPETRRAMVFIDSPVYVGERAKPCISSYQFMISKGKLDTIICARSWDLVSGFIYDTQVAGMVSLVVATLLHIPLGGMFGFAGSGHVYHKDVAEGRMELAYEGKYPAKRMSINTEFSTWEQAQLMALDSLTEFRNDPIAFQKPFFFNLEEV